MKWILQIQFHATRLLQQKLRSSTQVGRRTTIAAIHWSSRSTITAHSSSRNTIAAHWSSGNTPANHLSSRMASTGGTIVHKNRLALERSPYLLQHATNPVNWYPWSQEAFAAARAQNKLIFLSIGYSTCHWCHVMERESFESEAAAKVLNDNYVSIKVDREERPDVDQLYMAFVVASTNQGGWPLSVWLTPELQPVFGGTYYPPEGFYGRPGFTSILKTIAGQWEGNREKIRKSGESIIEAIRQNNSLPSMDKTLTVAISAPDSPNCASKASKSAPDASKSAPDASKSAPDASKSALDASKLSLDASKSPAPGSKAAANSKTPPDASKALQVTSLLLSQLTTRFEANFGGFGAAPKFPQPSNLRFLLLHHVLTGAGAGAGAGTAGKAAVKATEAKETTQKSSESAIRASYGRHMALHTLDMMARGGIHDHVAQGFARYSTDQRWHVPHFEKMLYDQAQLLLAYTDAFLLTREPRYETVCRDIVTYVCRDLLHESGGFYSAEDADSLPEHGDTTKKEGAFCVWTHEEVLDVLQGEKIPLEKGGEEDLWEVFCHHYLVEETGNVEASKDPHGDLKGQNVLTEHCSLSETANYWDVSVETLEAGLARGRSLLYERRSARPRPHRDEKLVTAWNGMMLSALARAGAAFGDEAYVKTAIHNAAFVRRHLDDGRAGLYRAVYRCDEGDKHDGEIVDEGLTPGRHPISGFCVDFAWTIRGLLDLYEATLDQSYLNHAVGLQRVQDEKFWDSDAGAYFCAREDPSILLRLKDDQDMAEPAANSVSAHNLLRLHRLCGQDARLLRCRQLLSVYADRLESIPITLPEMAAARLMVDLPTQQVIITGDPTSKATKAMLAVVHACPHPNRVLFSAPAHPNASLYTMQPGLLRYKPRQAKPVEGGTEEGSKQANKEPLPLVYVCNMFMCTLPISDPEKLKTRLLRDIQV